MKDRDRASSCLRRPRTRTRIHNLTSSDPATSASRGHTTWERIRLIWGEVGCLGTRAAMSAGSNSSFTHLPSPAWEPC